MKTLIRSERKNKVKAKEKFYVCSRKSCENFPLICFYYYTFCFRRHTHTADDSFQKKKNLHNSVLKYVYKLGIKNNNSRNIERKVSEVEKSSTI